MKRIRLFYFFITLSILVLTACRQTIEHPEIYIVHTNDTHSQIEPKLEDSVWVGGIVQRSAIIEAMREQYPDLLYLDAGDMVQGSPYFNIWNGQVEMLGMNLQQLIASTFGNHEFDNGIAGLDSMLQYAKFPIINCNYHCEGTGLEKYVKPHMIMEQQGVRIGITGVTCNPKHLIFDRNWKGIEYEDPAQAANREAALLKEAGCDLIILLSHVGYFEGYDSIGDIRIAQQTRNIDFIIGGHTHTELEEGVIYRNLDDKPVYISQTGARTSPIGFAKLQFSIDGQHTDGTPAYRLDTIICCKLHPEALALEGKGQQMEQFIAPYRDSLENKMNKVVGYADVLLFRDKTLIQSPLLNFTADALLEIGAKYTNEPIDASFMNVGGLRNDFPLGNIYIRDLYQVFPFENHIDIIELKGSLLKEQIDRIVSRRMQGMSNITFTIKGEGPDRKATNIKIGGKPIDPNKVYRIVTIDYLAEGNDNFIIFKQASSNRNSGVLIRDAMIEYIQEKMSKGEVLHAEIDNRFIVQ